MELNRLEEDFKRKLERRSIPPTEMAWDRLDAMLSVTEKKKQPKKRYWMYIAASFLGFLLVGVLLLNLEKGTTGTTNITSGDAVVTTVKATGSKKDNGSTGAAIEENTVDASPVKITPDNTIAAARSKKNIIEECRCSVLSVPKRANNAPVIQEEAVASQQVQAAQSQEAERLLENSLNSELAKKKSSVKVDANSLLSSVEDELENNFRSEMLQKVVKNYNTVKTSVANRNYQ